MSLPTPVVAKMHGKSEHATHEDRAVTHAGPIQSPGVNIMRVGTQYDVLEHPVHCQRHVRMSIEGVQVVLVVVHSPVQPTCPALAKPPNYTSTMALKLWNKSHSLK